MKIERESMQMVVTSTWPQSARMGWGFLVGALLSLVSGRRIIHTVTLYGVRIDIDAREK